MIESSTTRQKHQKGKHENNMKNRHIAVVSIGLSILSSHAGAEIVGHEKYAYDSTGNVVEKEIDGKLTRFDYEGSILQSDSHGITYLHDDAGRQRGKIRNGSVERKFSYQYGDKVTQVEENGVHTELFYNAEGHLVGKSGGVRTEVFTWDGLGLALRGEHLLVNEEHLVGAVPAMVDGEATVFDALGTTLSVGGIKVEATAFGEGFVDGLLTGKPFVEELGCVVFKHRNYSVREIRWGTPDPSGYRSGVNNTKYLGNDPFTSVDPLGLAEIPVTTSVFVGTSPSNGTPGIPGGLLFRVDVQTKFSSSSPTEIGGEPISNSNGVWWGGQWNRDITDNGTKKYKDQQTYSKFEDAEVEVKTIPASGQTEYSGTKVFTTKWAEK